MVMMNFRDKGRLDSRGKEGLKSRDQVKARF
jgi:hypothetical protein